MFVFLWTTCAAATQQSSGGRPSTTLHARLGGNAVMGNTYVPMWRFLVSELRITSVLDIGAGHGVAVRAFQEQVGVPKVLGVDGLPDNANSTVPVVLHDFARGVFVPTSTYDLCWSCFALEHMDHYLLANVMNTFKFCKYAAVAIGMNYGGHHHVTIHPWEPWWDSLFEAFGFEVDEALTRISRLPIYGTEDNRRHTWWSGGAKNHAPGKILRNTNTNAFAIANISQQLPPWLPRVSPCCDPHGPRKCQC